MRINNINLEDINVNVMSFNIAPLSIKRQIIKSENCLAIKKGVMENNTTLRELILEVRERKNINTILLAIADSIEVDVGDGFIYRGMVDNYTLEQDSSDDFVLNLKVDVLTQSNLVALDNPVNELIKGNIKTECKLRVLSSTVLNNYQVLDILILTLPANETLVIDSMSSKVYLESNPDISYFDNIDMLEFPKLTPGELITCGSADVNVKVEYYPTFIA